MYYSAPAAHGSPKIATVNSASRSTWNTMTRLATAAKYYQRPAHTHISVNISNQLSIGQKFDRHSQGLLELRPTTWALERQNNVSLCAVF